MYAYCYSSGDIHVAADLPADAIMLMSGPEAILRKRIGSNRRVPGIPAEDHVGERQAIDQFKRFLMAPRWKVRGA
ncbi:MAG: hypothetical protein CMO06_09720 [Thalassospira sp.]|jgi:hypothetical protein|uniref:hypothetical protein n=1 Tax=Thalassospira sp. TaxID=1912094 RepID=UPI000C4B3AFB|nr:hypothetical protein [Thalassospira sp.]MAZ33409.1 hypothetical protein [Thalassospira sp.]|tara:strand:- start:178 stop:402 length:225 start_codon:yes stop_codon:yes gene_type:complete